MESSCNKPVDSIPRMENLLLVFIPLFLYRCAKASAAAGYKFFGILNYAECWAEGTPKFHRPMVPPSKCWGPKPRFHSCDKNSPGPCVGTPDYQYIYEVDNGQ